MCGTRQRLNLTHNWQAVHEQAAMGICRLRGNRVCYALGEPAAGVLLLPDHP
ncbi:hypothetical protein ABIF90_006271 [Bradyrhizobium japonicum]